MPGALFDRATYHLVRAEGCFIQLEAAQKETKALRNQVAELQKESTALAKADTLTKAIEENTQKLTRKQKTAQWFKNAKKDITAVALGVVAAAEAAYIIYISVELRP